MRAAVGRHRTRAGGHSDGEAHLPAQSWNCVYPLTGAKQHRVGPSTGAENWHRNWHRDDSDEGVFEGTVAYHLHRKT
jgi:hypothetical protein